MNAGGMRSILFVCMGNICRSPMAEVLFRHKATLRGVEGELLEEFWVCQLMFRDAFGEALQKLT